MDIANLRACLGLLRDYMHAAGHIDPKDGEILRQALADLSALEAREKAPPLWMMGADGIARPVGHEVELASARLAGAQAMQRAAVERLGQTVERGGWMVYEFAAHSAASRAIAAISPEAVAGEVRAEAARAPEAT